VSNHETTVYFEDLAFLVNFDYYPASRGAREHGTGLQLEPDESASFEICTISMIHPDDAKIPAVDVSDQIPATLDDWFNDQIVEYMNKDEGE
jgi:hypothetical protein